jgi:hypothetical protein
MLVLAFCYVLGGLIVAGLRVPRASKTAAIADV